MKGVLLLSEGRTGSTWLVRQSNGTGVMGNGREWFRSDLWRDTLGAPSTPEDYIAEVLRQAKTENDVFCIKVFPSHHQRFYRKYGIDLVWALCREHDVLCITLERRDTLGQAVSFARARQTGAWNKKTASQQKPEYDFGEIARFFIRSKSSTAYWSNYTALRNLPALPLCYEDMLPDAAPYLTAVAQHCGITGFESPENRDTIQRDDMNQDWRERFESDLAERDVMPYLKGHLPLIHRLRILFRGTPH